jgi:NAD(P)-dependent dehydrogenase (short-subunit alcohol dehydrogenase family)
LAREGAKVLLVDAVASRAEETLAIIEEEGGEASVFEADVTRSDDCRAMVDATIERYGPPSILFNNAAVNAVRGHTVADLEEDEWDRVMGINLKGVMLTSGHTVPAMVEGGGGSIINVSSTAGIRGGGEVSYAVAKGGVISLTYSMAAHHGRDNIRVNCLIPGHLWTPMVSAGANSPGGVPMNEEHRDRRRRAWAQRAPRGTLPGRWFSWQATRPAGFQARSFLWTPEHRQCCRSKCSD